MTDAELVALLHSDEKSPELVARAICEALERGSIILNLRERIAMIESRAREAMA